MSGLRSMNIILKVTRDIEAEADRRIMLAARHVRRAVVKSARSLYKKRSGNLFKGIAAEKRGSNGRGGVYAVVGMTAPAYHAHLLERGTKERIVKNYRGKPGVAVRVGRVKAKPFFAPAMESEKSAVQQILSGTWVG